MVPEFEGPGEAHSTTNLVPQHSQTTPFNNSLENGRTTELYYNRFIKIDMCIRKILYCNFAILVVYYEYDYNNVDGLYTSSISVLLWGLGVCAILGTIMLVFREVAKLHLDVHQKKEFRLKFSTKRVLRLVLQCLIQLVQPYPLINDMTLNTYNYQQHLEFEFKINYLLVILGILKVYLVWNIMISESKYSTPRANRLAQMYMCQANQGFSIKCMFKEYPMTLVTWCFFISIIIFSFALRVAERSRYFTNTVADFNYLSNAIWLTVITLTTVGYGDVVPKTSIGRAIVIVLVLWGAFIVSIMVAVLNNIFSMDQRELKVLTLVKKLERKKLIRVAAVNLIKHIWKYNHYNSKVKKGEIVPQSSPQQSHQRCVQYTRKLKRYQKVLFRLMREADAICQEDDVYEDINREFECLEGDLKNLTHNQEVLTNIIHDKIEQKIDRHD